MEPAPPVWPVGSAVGDALRVAVVIVEAGDRAPLDFAAVALQRQRMHPVALVEAVDVVGEGAGAEWSRRVAVDVERAPA